MSRKAYLALTTAIVMAAAIGCSADPTTTDEYQALQDELTSLEQTNSETRRQLDAVTAERDELLAQRALAEERYEKSNATLDAVGQLGNTLESEGLEAFGSEEAFLDEMMKHATPDAVMDDSAYGAVPLRDGWRNTLFRGPTDATVKEWHNWMCADGSQGGSLWTWAGLNEVGEPFELIGVALIDYNNEGLETYEYVIWPSPDEYVYTEWGARP